MRVFTVSDLHIDFPQNESWLFCLSTFDYQEDIIIVPGDIHHEIPEIKNSFRYLKKCFREVFYVPGNHDLWCVSKREAASSLDKFAKICQVAQESGVKMSPATIAGITIVPLLSWYDYSFGTPNDRLRRTWMDFRHCQWPEEWEQKDICDYFLKLNEPYIQDYQTPIITFSHFLPRMDLLEFYHNSPTRAALFPVLGSKQLEKQIRRLQPVVHIYGHSHINRDVGREGVRYLNNAYGYPRETKITRKELVCLDGIFF